MIRKYIRQIIYIGIGLLLFALLYALKNTSYFVRAAGFLFFIILTFAADSFFKFRFKNYHYAIVILIATFAILLSPLYYLYPLYDKVLHIIVPVLLGLIIFFLVNKLDTKLSIKLVITFAILVAMISIHEMGEYLLDQIFDWRLQGVYLRDYTGIAKLKIVLGKNTDTMVDMILSTLGALIFVLIKTANYWYGKLILKKDI
jgi:hypothetical protein